MDYQIFGCGYYSSMELSKFLDAVLDEEQEREIREHLEICQECKLAGFNPSPLGSGCTACTNVKHNATMNCNTCTNFWSGHPTCGDCPANFETTNCAA